MAWLVYRRCHCCSEAPTIQMVEVEAVVRLAKTLPQVLLHFAKLRTVLMPVSFLLVLGFEALISLVFHFDIPTEHVLIVHRVISFDLLCEG